MDKRIAKALAAGTVVALPLLGACGASTAPTSSSAAPGAPSVAAPSSAAQTPAPSSTPVDETKSVQATTSKFVQVAFTLGGPVQTSKDWAARVKPLMSEKGYDSLRGEVTVEDTLKTLEARYGAGTRTVSGLVGTAKVKKLEADRATVDISFQSRLQQQSGDTWKTIKKSPVETGTIQLVKQDEKWLVDDAG